MPECNYCSESFDDDASYEKHLESEHEDELSRIDRRRIGDADESDGGISRGPIVLGAVLVIGIAMAGYAVFAATASDGSDGPHSPGTAHQHGTMEVIIEGEQLALTSPEFAQSDDLFHFHGGQSSPVWHTHAQDVTVQYALETLGFEVNDNGTVLSYDGNTYREGESGTEILIEVDGESVTPGEYVLQGVTSTEPDGGGDHLRVVVRTDA